MEEAHPDGAEPDEVGPGEEEPTPTIEPAEPEEALETDPAGLSGEEASNPPAILWGLAAAFVWFVAWWFARGRRPVRKWLTYAVMTPVFLVVLFIFFENFSRLLPANY